MCVKNNTHVARTSRSRMSTTWNLYCCLVPQCEALHTCCSAFPITTKWCFEQDVMVVPDATFTKKTCSGCGSLQKPADAVATFRLALHWKCGFRMANTWRWPEMNMYLDLNLVTFQYIDGFGCYHFCLKQIWIGIDDFLLNFGTFGPILWLQITVTFGSVLWLQVNTGLKPPTRWEPFVAGTMLRRSQSTKGVEPMILSIIAVEITHLTRFALLLLLRILSYMRRNHVATWA